LDQKMRRARATSSLKEQGQDRVSGDTRSSPTKYQKREKMIGACSKGKRKAIPKDPVLKVEPGVSWEIRVGAASGWQRADRLAKHREERAGLGG